MLNSVTETKNAPYLDQDAKIKKIRVLCFQQLSKLEKIRCLYFFAILAFGRDMGTFAIIKGTLFLLAPINLKLTLNMVAIPEIKLKSPNIFYWVGMILRHAPLA